MYIHAHYMIYDTSINSTLRIEFSILMSTVYLISHLPNSNLYKEKNRLSSHQFVSRQLVASRHPCS